MSKEKTIGQEVREARKKLRWSQSRLGEEVGCTGSTISHIENGYKVLPPVLAAVKFVLGLMDHQKEYKESIQEAFTGDIPEIEDLAGYPFETRDNYEGCDPDIKRALMNGLQVKGWTWAGDSEWSYECWVVAYAGHLTAPYFCVSEEGGYVNTINFSLTDPNEKHYVTTKHDARDWCNENMMTLLKKPDGSIVPAGVILWIDIENVSEYSIQTGVDIDTGAPIWTPITEMEM